MSTRDPYQVVLYGAVPYSPENPWEPVPSPPTYPIQPFQPFIDPAEVQRLVDEAMKKRHGKVDPPPAEANRELDAIRALVTALEGFNALVKSLAEQLTADERRRVLRYIKDRYEFPIPKEEP